MMAGTVPQMGRLTRRLEYRAARLGKARLFSDEARHDLTYVGDLAPAKSENVRRAGHPLIFSAAIFLRGCLADRKDKGECAESVR
jgi:hypothetical protein